MSSRFEALAANEGVWEGVWTYYRAPVPGRTTLEAVNQRRSTLIFERLAGDCLRQTNRYHGQGEFVWEYYDRPGGLEWFEVKGEERKPGDPNFIAAVRAFPGSLSFTSGYLRLLEGVPFVSEQGVGEGDCKRRGMVMYDQAGQPATLIAIRERRGAPVTAEEDAPLTLADLMGSWQGEGIAISANDQTVSGLACRFHISEAGDALEVVSQFGETVTRRTARAEGAAWALSGGQRLVVLPGRLALLYPDQLPPPGEDRSFSVELYWLAEPTRLRRLVREYDPQGAWRRSVLTDEHRQ
ncbi:MAG: DUF3598 family protein [Chloroflexi bacterium]|nr:DUF3598 family protein [Chloroflexota bacterium]